MYKCVSSFLSVSGFYLLSFFFLSFLSSFFFVFFLYFFFLSFILSLVFAILQTRAISCTRLKFDCKMTVYELYVYGDVHVMNFIVFLPFFLSLVFTDKCNILHETEVRLSNESI